MPQVWAALAASGAVAASCIRPSGVEASEVAWDLRTLQPENNACFIIWQKKSLKFLRILLYIKQRSNFRTGTVGEPCTINVNQSFHFLLSPLVDGLEHGITWNHHGRSGWCYGWSRRQSHHLWLLRHHHHRLKSRCCGYCWSSRRLWRRRGR